MAEVSVDQAASEEINVSEEVTNRLDDIITDVVNKLKTSKHIPTDILLVSEVQKRSELFDENVSVVRCFKYLMINLEKIVSGEDPLSDLVENNIECCSLDLAASYLRTNAYLRKHKLNIEDYLENI